MKTPRDKTVDILRLLSKEYPDAKAELNFSNPFETLIATMLSAQCTDKRVNEVTKVLFNIAPDPESMAKLSVEELEGIIKPCGLYHAKARQSSPRFPESEGKPRASYLWKRSEQICSPWIRMYSGSLTE